MGLVYHALNQSSIPTIKLSDSESGEDEDEESDSDEEEIGPTDFVKLIEELANSCNRYEDKIVTLRVGLIFNLKSFF